MTREEAITRLTRLKNIAWLYGSVEREQNLEAIDMAIEALQTEPKHGEWISIFDNTWECTNCETCEQFAYNIESTSDYCPNCGAKMDKGGDPE